jgi:hypothetical protein
MDQALEYLKLGAYYGCIASMVICFLILLGYMLWYKQWLYFFVSLFFVVCLGAGFLIPLVIGWQEEKKWKIPKLIRIYSALVVVCSFFMMSFMWKELTTHKEQVDPRVAKQKAALAKFKGATGAGKVATPPKPR